MSSLIGICNQCGLCCMTDGLRCHNLIIGGKPGMPKATFCAIYDSRYVGMPILFVDASGKVVSDGVCAYGDPVEDLVIVERGLGKGCSLSPA